jgi:hypothetical protein
MSFFQYCCLLGSFLWAFSLSAQTNQQDVVYLTNGSIIKGKLLLFEPTGVIKIEILGGSVFVYPSSEVVKISKEAILRPSININKTKDYFKGTGFTHRFSLETMLGQSQYGIMPGFGLHYQSNYHLHRLLGLGGGVGINTFLELSFVPVYANIKGYFMKSSATLYYDLNIGYGIILPSYHINSNGGFYIRPAFGLRFSSSSSLHLFLDFGYNIQFANTETYDWNNNSIYYKHIFYRPSLRFGLSF